MKKILSFIVALLFCFLSFSQVPPCPPADPIVTAVNTSICLGSSVNLSANSTSNGVQYYWYNVPTGGTILDSGANYISTPLSPGTYTYYAEAVINGSTGGGGTNTSISSGFATNNGHGGVMFDVEALSCDVIISAVDGQIDPGSGSIDFYYRTNSCQNTWQSDAGWVYLGCTTVTGNGSGVATNLQFPTPVTIPAGQRYAICIMASQGWKYENGTAFGTVLMSNTDLIWYEGWGTTVYGNCAQAFSQSYVNNPRKFRGTIYYSTSCNVQETCYSNRIPVTVTVTEGPNITATANNNTINCNNTSSIITATTTNGNGSYTYQWNAGSPNNTQSIIVSSGGTYNVTVSSGGCTASTSITINEDTTIPSVNIDTPDGSIINCTNNSINVVTTGNGNYFYQWNGGSTPYSANNTFFTNNTYTLTVTDANNGCTTSSSISITIDQNNPIATIITNPNTTLLSCSTESISITANGADEFTWNNGITTANQIITSPGNYTVTITNSSNGCSDVENIVITQDTTHPIIIFTSNTGNFELNCSISNITISASGGNNYVWNGGYQPNQSSNTFSQAGTYIVTVTNTSNNCKNTASITITTPEPLISNINADSTALCNGDLAIIEITASGGTPPYQGIGNFNIGAGSHSFTITDANNCVSISSITLTQPPKMFVELKQTDIIKCYGEENASLNAIVSGGVMPYYYNWNNSSNTFNSNNNPIANIAAGTYTVTITDNNGCALTKSFVINQPNKFIMNYEYKDILCNGNNNGSLDILLSGGIKPYKYEVTSENNFKKYLSNYSDLREGNYNIMVSDYNNCKHTANFVIKEPLKIETNFYTEKPSCKDALDGKIIVDIQGGVAPYRYYIDNKLFTDSTLYYMQSGNYEIIIKDSNNCIKSLKKIIIDENHSNCLLIPTAITPNGDGKNDTWKIEGLDLFFEYEILVFNRWGQMLYKSTNLSDPNWDGKYKSKFVPTGTYLYVINTKGRIERKYTGSISVIY